MIGIRLSLILLINLIIKFIFICDVIHLCYKINYYLVEFGTLVIHSLINIIRFKLFTCLLLVREVDTVIIGLCIEHDLKLNILSLLLIMILVLNLLSIYEIVSTMK